VTAVTRLLGVVTGLAAACTDVGLYSPDRDPNLADRLAISADLCTDDPGQRSFPVRVALVVDGSAGAYALDPGAKRADAVLDVLARYRAMSSHAFSVIRLGESARDLTGGFVRDRSILDEAVAALRAAETRQGRDVLSGLLAASNAVDEHLLGSSPGLASRTTYIVVLVVAGAPIPSTGQGKAALAERIRRMRTHALDMGAAALRLHAVLLRPDDPQLAEEAESVYKEAALAGNGEFVSVTIPQNLSLTTLDLGAGATIFVKKQIVATNRNAIVTPDGAVPDSDGDGLSDDEEVEEGLDPLTADTDGDGLSDRVEMLHRAGGQDPWTADLPPACASLDDPTADSDADGLTDCEERVLGTDLSLFDSDHPPDGLPDVVELLCDTNPMHDDTVLDYDFDGETNGEECRRHTDPRGDDGESRWSLAYRYREYDEGRRVVPFSSQPLNVTGVAILGLSQSTVPGVGTLCWDPGPPGELTWQDAGDTAAGRPVLAPGREEAEVSVHSDSEHRWVRLHVTRRLLPQRAVCDSIVVGASPRNCFSFRVKNVTLVHTLDTGRGPGWNDVYVYFAQVPEESPNSPGLFRVALIRARFIPPDFRVPDGPEVYLRDLDFVLFGD